MPDWFSETTVHAAPEQVAVAPLEYGYEYLGEHRPSMVLTPPVERATRSLVMASRRAARCGAYR